MREVLRPALWAVVGVSLLALVSCGKNESQTGEAPAAPEATEPVEAAPPAPAVDLAAEEQAIRGLNAQWISSINAKDAVGSVAMYAADGGVYAPNAAPAVGADALKAMWDQLMQTPNLAFTSNTEKLVIAQSGDLAVDIGTYTLTSGDPASPTIENGKFVVTWVKRDGQWKVLTDMFSSNGPTPAPATMMAPGGAMAPMQGMTQDGMMAPAAPAETAPPAEAPAAPPAPAPGTEH